MKKILLFIILLSSFLVNSAILAADMPNPSRMESIKSVPREVQNGFAAAFKKHIKKQPLTDEELVAYQAATNWAGGPAKLLTIIATGPIAAGAIGADMARKKVAELRANKPFIQRLSERIEGASQAVKDGIMAAHKKHIEGQALSDEEKRAYSSALKWAGGIATLLIAARLLYSWLLNLEEYETEETFGREARGFGSGAVEFVTRKVYTHPFTRKRRLGRVLGTKMYGV